MFTSHRQEGRPTDVGAHTFSCRQMRQIPSVRRSFPPMHLVSLYSRTSFSTSPSDPHPTTCSSYTFHLAQPPLSRPRVTGPPVGIAKETQTVFCFSFKTTKTYQSLAVLGGAGRGQGSQRSLAVLHRDRWRHSAPSNTPASHGVRIKDWYIHDMKRQRHERLSQPHVRTCEASPYSPHVSRRCCW